MDIKLFMGSAGGGVEEANSWWCREDAVALTEYDLQGDEVIKTFYG